MIVLDKVSMKLTTGPLKSLVLQNVSATLPTNERLVILGGPQSGKSTLISLLAGLTAPTEGKITSHAKLSFPVGFQSGYRANVSVRENIAYVARLYGADVSEVVRFVVQTADIGDFLKHKFSALPPQLRARMVYALSYAIPFETYLIDNRPGPGDEDFRAKCERMLELRAKEGGFILTTSLPNLAKKFASRAGILHQRSLKLYDDVDEAIEIYKFLPKNPGLESETADEQGDWTDLTRTTVQSGRETDTQEPRVFAQIAIRNSIRQDFAKLLADNGIMSGKIAEIGPPHKSFADGMPGYAFEFLTLHGDKSDPRVRPADICYCPHIPDQSFDAIVSVGALENVARPHEAAREMTRILKPDGIMYHATPFGNQYRGAPTDFWRLTPEAFKTLFASLACLKADFIPIAQLRDSSAPDARDNIYTIYAGRKTAEALKEFRTRRDQQLIVDLVAMLIDLGAAENTAFELAAILSPRIYIDVNGDPRRRPKAGQPRTDADRVRNLWRNKRKLGIPPTPNRFALGKIVSQMFPQASR
ncbi:MAG: methyltransferase domain-containing protein [Rhodoblastus sp.]